MKYIIRFWLSVNVKRFLSLPNAQLYDLLFQQAHFFQQVIVTQWTFFQVFFYQKGLLVMKINTLMICIDSSVHFSFLCFWAGVDVDPMRKWGRILFCSLLLSALHMSTTYSCCCSCWMFLSMKKMMMCSWHANSPPPLNCSLLYGGIFSS